MTNSLIISVRLHEGWYHGAGSIPSPARLFQALAAGRGLGGPLQLQTIEALQWLEKQRPPIVAAPVTICGQLVATYVPNNDLDAKQGDHRRMGDIRTKKTAHPLLFDPSVPFLFCWKLTDEDMDESAVKHIQELANGLYQLGRTVDAAWACADVVTTDELGDHLRCHRGPVLRPASGQGNVECPTPGSVHSLIDRHSDMARRYGPTADGKGQTFRRRSKPKWRMVSYGNAMTRICFDLLDRETSTHVAWSPTETVALVTMIRDEAVNRLVAALPAHEAEIQQALIGRKPTGENAGLASARVRIVPLPSIGHEHADQQIRRVVIEIPGNCPLRTDDVVWAFSAQKLSHRDRCVDLVTAQPNRQLEHYGVTSAASRLWQTVTPVALSARRRRIEPDRTKRQLGDEKGAAERRMEHEVAASGIRQALRHAGYEATIRSIRLQREPFTARGQMADDFATEPRFSKHCLWHVSLELNDQITGPICVGDGRFLGLGLMRPVVAVVDSDGVSASNGIFAFTVESGLLPNADPIHLARALRRAVMARVQHELGPRTRLPTFFSAHYPDGTPAKSEKTPHLSFQFDPENYRLLVIAPQFLHRNSSHQFPKNLDMLETALTDFRELRAGKAGCLRLQLASVDSSDTRLFGPSQDWKSVTPYSVNRHAKHATVKETLCRDVLAECEGRGFPRPQAIALDWLAQSGKSLSGHIRLTFKQLVSGPIILGRTRHLGGGLFAPCPNNGGAE